MGAVAAVVTRHQRSKWRLYLRSALPSQHKSIPNQPIKPGKLLCDGKVVTCFVVQGRCLRSYKIHKTAAMVANMQVPSSKGRGFQNWNPKKHPLLKRVGNQLDTVHHISGWVSPHHDVHERWQTAVSPFSSMKNWLLFFSVSRNKCCKYSTWNVAKRWMSSNHPLISPRGRHDVPGFSGRVLKTQEENKKKHKLSSFPKAGIRKR